MKVRSFVVLLVFIGLSLAAQGQKAVPELWNTRIHDDAGILQPSTIASLENQLKVFEDSTSNQIAILTVTSLDGDPIEEYALRVAEKWKLGQAQKDNGVLLLIAKDDRKMRIEVGMGLEGPLPDALCNRIIRNEMAPRFRQGDFDGGVQAAVNAIIQSIKGEYVADESDVNVNNSGSEGPNFFIAAIFLFVIGSLTWNSLFSKGGVSWFMYVFQIPFYYFFPPLGFGATLGNGIFWGFLIAFPILRLLIQNTPWGQAMIKKMEENQKNNRSRGGGWSSGGGWYGGGGGWSSGGGSSWSGGGGSFGGGGSSGSW
jgi:uncharacterized protein